MKPKPRLIMFSFILYALVALPAIALPQEGSKADDDEEKKKIFRVVGSEADQNGQLSKIVEKNGLHQIRTTVFSRFPDKPKIVHTQLTTTEKVTDGGVVIKEDSVLYTYDRDGNQVSYSKEVYNGRGNVMSGERWYIPEYNGQYSGPIIVEEYDSRSSGWKKQNAGVSGDWEFNGTIGFNRCGKDTIITIVQMGNAITAKFKLVPGALSDCYDQGAVFFQGVQQPDGTFLAKMNVTWWENDDVTDIVLAIQEDGSLHGSAGLATFNLKRRGS